MSCLNALPSFLVYWFVLFCIFMASIKWYLSRIWIWIGPFLVEDVENAVHTSCAYFLCYVAIASTFGLRAYRAYLGSIFLLQFGVTRKHLHDEEVPRLEPDSNDTYLCQLCAHKETLECSPCHLFLCNKCMADHLCDLPDDQPSLYCVVVSSNIEKNCVFQNLLLMSSLCM